MAEKSVPTLYEWLGGNEVLVPLIDRFYEKVGTDDLLADLFALRWVDLLIETANEMQLKDDPEFRSALVAYLEWGSRLAVINSAMEAGTKIDEAPMPMWGWGVPGGPFQG